MPFEPINPKVEPSATSNDTSFRAWKSSWTERLRLMIIDLIV